MPTPIPSKPHSELLEAASVIDKAKTDLNQSVQQAVEKAIECWQDRWPGGVLPEVNVTTTPKMVYGGRPQKIAARVTVTFLPTIPTPRFV